MSKQVSELKGVIIDSHNLARQGFTHVDGIAHLALMAMQTPEAYRSAESFAAAWDAVRCISQDIMSCVDSQVESAGLPINDDAADRRLAARLEDKEDE